MNKSNVIKIWQAFTRWLMEPIPFPGMTFEPRNSRTKGGQAIGSRLVVRS
jgi:hypothetical protein